MATTLTTALADQKRTIWQNARRITTTVTYKVTSAIHRDMLFIVNSERRTQTICLIKLKSQKAILHVQTGVQKNNTQLAVFFKSKKRECKEVLYVDIRNIRDIERSVRGVRATVTYAHAC